MLRKALTLIAIGCWLTLSNTVFAETVLVCEGAGTITSKASRPGTSPEATKTHFTVVLHTGWLKHGHESAEVSGDIHGWFRVNPKSTDNVLIISDSSYLLGTNSYFSDGRTRSSSSVSIDRRSLRFDYQRNNYHAPTYLNIHTEGQCRKSGEKI